MFNQHNETHLELLNVFNYSPASVADILERTSVIPVTLERSCKKLLPSRMSEELNLLLLLKVLVFTVAEELLSTSFTPVEEIRYYFML